MNSKNFNIKEFTCKCGSCEGGTEIIKAELVVKLQALRDLYGKPLSINSGYRCTAHNRKIGGALRSAHLEGSAADLADSDGAIKAFCSEGILEQLGLWAEDYAKTPSWIHLQIRPARVRIFRA